MVVPLSSQVPGHSIKAIEAMALGTPIIISNPTDSRIFRDGETCVVVHDNSSVGWQEAIARIGVPEYRERIARGARAEVEAFRAMQNVNVILRLLNGGHTIQE